ncbi:MAG: helix-turn-helix domain-containing protein, partial [Gemmatimonadota bacterium]
QALMDYSWPGNIRELGHAVERAVLLAQGGQIRAADLGLRSGSGGASATGAAPRLDDLTLAEAEQLMIRRALARFEGNVSLAAKHLGLSRSALYRRLGEVTRDA